MLDESPATATQFMPTLPEGSVLFNHAGQYKITVTTQETDSYASISETISPQVLLNISDGILRSNLENTENVPLQSDGMLLKKDADAITKITINVKNYISDSTGFYLFKNLTELIYHDLGLSTLDHPFQLNLAQFFLARTRNHYKCICNK